MIDKVLVQEVSGLGRSTVEVLKVLEELSNFGISVYVQNFGIETLKKGKRNPIAQFMFTPACRVCPSGKRNISGADFIRYR